MASNPNLHHWQGSLAVRGIAWLLIGLLQVLARPQASHAADPYAAALDQRFATATASVPTAAEVAAVEEALKQQVSQMSTKAEPSSAGSADSFEQFLSGAFVMAGVLGAAIAALAGLRRWN